MATITLEAPTTLDGTPITGGKANIIFTAYTITVRDLIKEKIRSEFRKLRAGGPSVTSLDALCGTLPATPEQGVTLALDTFYELYTVVVDGQARQLDDVVTVKRSTEIEFRVMDVVPDLTPDVVTRQCPECGGDKAFRLGGRYEYDTNAGEVLEYDDSLSCECRLTADQWDAMTRTIRRAEFGAVGADVEAA